MTTAIRLVNKLSADDLKKVQRELHFAYLWHNTAAQQAYEAYQSHPRNHVGSRKFIHASDWHEGRTTIILASDAYDAAREQLRVRFRLDIPSDAPFMYGAQPDDVTAITENIRTIQMSRYTLFNCDAPSRHIIRASNRFLRREQNFTGRFLRGNPDDLLEL